MGCDPPSTRLATSRALFWTPWTRAPPRGRGKNPPKKSGDWIRGREYRGITAAQRGVLEKERAFYAAIQPPGISAPPLAGIKTPKPRVHNGGSGESNNGEPALQKNPHRRGSGPTHFSHAVN
ncbi:hypothetical protein BGS_1261 [Beggiatoa sp. SS]|nr:hypothetical protein BGS_1261 [Beggiatoa sp. SS]